MLSLQQVGKALSFASFIPEKADADWLCFKEILALAERESGRFSRGRVRIIISDGTCALLNAQQIKMVSREACICAMCSRTGQGLHVCMRAYLCNLLGSAARKGAHENRRLRAFPLWGIHIQTKLTFICGIKGEVRRKMNFTYVLGFVVLRDVGKVFPVGSSSFARMMTGENRAQNHSGA